MASIMKLQIASALIVAVMFALYSTHGVSCQEGDKRPLGPQASGKNPSDGMPVIVVRQNTGGSSSGGGSSSSSGEDIWLGWLNWDGLSYLKPFTGPFVQQVSPFTQGMSSMVIGNMPGGSSMYQQFDEMGNQISKLNPMSQILSQFGGSSGSGGLSVLFSGRRRR